MVSRRKHLKWFFFMTSIRFPIGKIKKEHYIRKICNFVSRLLGFTYNCLLFIAADVSLFLTNILSLYFLCTDWRIRNRVYCIKVFMFSVKHRSIEHSSFYPIAIPCVLLDLCIEKNYSANSVFPPLHYNFYKLLIETSIHHWVTRMLFVQLII